MKLNPSKLLVFWIILLLSCKDPESDKPVSDLDSNSLLITNVTIFNGRDSVLLENRNVLVENGEIKAIIKSEIPFKEKKIDGTGKFLIPGFIDAHVHLSGSGAVPWANVKPDMEYNLKAYLQTGITTVYDLGGLASELNKLAAKVEKREVLGPSIFHTHIPITVPNSHPIPLSKEILTWPLNKMVEMISPVIKTPEDAPKVIKNYLEKEVDYVKIICDQIPPGSPEMSLKQMKAVAQVAHDNGKKVIAHIGSPDNAIAAVEAGIDVLAHGIWRERLNEEQATRIAQSQIPIIYTAAAFHNVSEIQNGNFQHSALDKELVPAEILDPVTGDKGKDVHQQNIMNEFFKQVADEHKNLELNFKLLKQHEAKILVGTDSNTVAETRGPPVPTRLSPCLGHCIA